MKKLLNLLSFFLLVVIFTTACSQSKEEEKIKKSSGSDAKAKEYALIIKAYDKMYDFDAANNISGDIAKKATLYRELDLIMTKITLDPVQHCDTYTRYINLAVAGNGYYKKKYGGSFFVETKTMLDYFDAFGKKTLNDWKAYLALHRELGISPSSTKRDEFKLFTTELRQEIQNSNQDPDEKLHNLLTLYGTLKRYQCEEGMKEIASLIYRKNLSIAEWEILYKDQPKLFKDLSLKKKGDGTLETFLKFKD